MSTDGLRCGIGEWGRILGYREEIGKEGMTGDSATRKLVASFINIDRMWTQIEIGWENV